MPVTDDCLECALILEDLVSKAIACLPLLPVADTGENECCSTEGEGDLFFVGRSSLMVLSVLSSLRLGEVWRTKPLIAMMQDLE